MENFWPDTFDLNEAVPLKKLLDEQGALLLKVTNGYVEGEVLSSHADIIEHITVSKKPEFVYRFELIAKYLDDYRYKLFTFSHDITLYPASLVLDDIVGQELGIKTNLFNRYVYSINNLAEAKVFLPRMFATDRVRSIVGSILKLSQ